MEIELIKFVNIIECMLCLHRTISNSTCTLRVLKYLHVSLEHFVIITNVVACYFNVTKYDKIVTMEILLSTAHSLAILILAVYKSKKYKQMLEYFNINHLHLKADPQYNKNLKNILILDFVLLLATFILVFGVLGFFPFVITGVDLCIDYILYVNLLVCAFRFLFEFYVLFSILNVMSEQLGSIIRSVEEFEAVKRGSNPEIVCQVKLQVFDTWSSTYTNIKESSKLFNNIYGFQVRINFIYTFLLTFILRILNVVFFLHR